MNISYESIELCLHDISMTSRELDHMREHTDDPDYLAAIHACFVANGKLYDAVMALAILCTEKSFPMRKE